MTDQISLLRRDNNEVAATTAKAYSGRGISIEHVLVNAPGDIDFKWSGRFHYFAIHNMKMKDGETRASDVKPFRLLDLRRRMTYLPPGAEISGWSSFSAGHNSFTAIKFDLSDLFEGSFRGREDELGPRLYFGQPELVTTMTKLDALMRLGEDADPILLESAAVLAVAELVTGAAKQETMKGGPKLSASQQRLVVDYIEGNLGRKITLTELAGVLNLNRFYFSRCFSATFSMSPYQYLLLRRIEKAKALLCQPGLSVAAVAHAVGFSSPSQFSYLFKRAIGASPREFRLAVL